MPNLWNLAELHKRVVGEINESRRKETSEFVSRKSEERKRAENEVAEELKRQKDAGVDVDRHEEAHRKLAVLRKRELDEIRKRYAAREDEPKSITPEDFVARGLDAALAPADVKALPPSYAAVFSTKDPDDKLSGGT